MDIPTGAAHTGARNLRSGGGRDDFLSRMSGVSRFRSSGRLSAYDRMSWCAINGEGASSHDRNGFSNGAGDARDLGMNP